VDFKTNIGCPAPDASRICLSSASDASLNQELSYVLDESHTRDRRSLEYAIPLVYRPQCS
jgi:hypothetical protein